MKNLMLGIFALSLLFSAKSFAIFAKDTPTQSLLTRANNSSPLEGIGTVINRTKNLMVAVYDFTVLGGASAATVLLVDDAGNAAILPFGAIVTNVVADVITSYTSASGSATLGFQLLTAVDLMAQTAKGSLTAGSFVAGKPVGTAATWVGPVTNVNGTQVAVTPLLGAATAGKIKYFIEYVIQ